MKNKSLGNWARGAYNKLKRKEKLDPVEMARLQKDISTYVYVLTDKRIPVRYNTKSEDETSYTSGDKIVIGGKIREDTWDQTIGTALHEASHIVRTDFQYFQSVMKNPYDHMSQDVIDKAEAKNFNEEAVKKILKPIWNVVEDRWIDQWCYDDSPGFRKYYDAMYDAFWNSEHITKALKTGELEVKRDGKLTGDTVDISDSTWQSYMFHFTNVSNEEAHRNASRLPGLKEIFDVLNLPKIRRFDSTKDTMEKSVEIFDIMLDHVEEDADEQMRKSPEEAQKEIEEMIQEMFDELGDDFKDQLKFGEGETGKYEISNDMQIEIDVFADKDTTEEEVGGKSNGDDSTNQNGDNPFGSNNGHYDDSVTVPRTKAYVIGRITNDMIDSGRFGMINENVNYETKEAVNEGVVLGKRLGRKIQIRDEIQVNKQVRQRKGKLDGNMLSEITYNSRLFKTKTTEEYDRGFIHISIDASGSMSGTKWKNSIISAVAICKAVDMIQSVDVQVSFRTMHNNRPTSIIAYDSQDNRFNHILNVWPHLYVCGSTPEGLCYEATMKHMLKSATGAGDRYFLNYSDGYPGCGTDNGHYGGQAAVDHTARQIREMKKEGIKILSYFITNRDEYNQSWESGTESFKEMYGKDAKYISVTDVGEVSRSLNQKFLEK